MLVCSATFIAGGWADQVFLCPSHFQTKAREFSVIVLFPACVLDCFTIADDVFLFNVTCTYALFISYATEVKEGSANSRDHKWRAQPICYERMLKLRTILRFPLTNIYKRCDGTMYKKDERC